MPSMLTVFGTEIKVNTGWRVNQSQFSGCAGANGVTGMYLGTRGRLILVSGTLRYSAATFLQARFGLISAIDYLIATYTGIAEDTWTCGAYESYANTAFYLMSPIQSTGPDGTTKMYHWNGVSCYCKFNAYLWQML